MRLKLLGTAAGGGFPQWNCRCRNCQGYRAGTIHAKARTQSSLAIAAKGGRWLVVNASPDISAQLEQLHPREGQLPSRWSPVAGVMLTDSQIDHTAGLLLLRESGQALPVYCTPAVRDNLRTEYPLLTMLESYCGVEARDLPVGGEAFAIPELSGVKLRVIPLEGKAPPYTRSPMPRPGTNVALAFVDEASGRSALYAPGLKGISDELRPWLAAADVLLVDGTCWWEDDLPRAGCGNKLASSMGHLALAGEGGLLQELAHYPRARRILVHINNTNPILDEDSPEHRELRAMGIEVGVDGQEIEC